MHKNYLDPSKTNTLKANSHNSSYWKELWEVFCIQSAFLLKKVAGATYVWGREDFSKKGKSGYCYPVNEGEIVGHPGACITITLAFLKFVCDKHMSYTKAMAGNLIISSEIKHFFQEHCTSFELISPHELLHTHTHTHKYIQVKTMILQVITYKTKAF